MVMLLLECLTVDFVYEEMMSQSASHFHEVYVVQRQHQIATAGGRGTERRKGHMASNNQNWQH